jgi:excisionase family DNA binding protein
MSIPYLTLKQVAEHLHVSYQWVRQMVISKTLEAVKLGSQKVVPLDSYATLLAERRAHPPRPGRPPKEKTQRANSGSFASKQDRRDHR